MLLHVLAHVDPDHRVLGVEHELGKRTGELGLAYAGGAEEQKGADRAVGILQPSARAAQSSGNSLDRLVLADDAFVQPLLHVNQLLDFTLQQARDGDAGPARHDLGNVLGVDLLLEENRAAFPSSPESAPPSLADSPSPREPIVFHSLFVLGRFVFAKLLLELGDIPVAQLARAR